jgi:hypothetical protein
LPQNGSRELFALAVDESVRVIEIPALDLERDFDIVYHEDKAMEALGNVTAKSGRIGK